MSLIQMNIETISHRFMFFFLNSKQTIQTQTFLGIIILCVERLKK